MEIISGPPFAGKSQYVEREIAKAEERGQILIDLTRIYEALFPSVLDRVRDEDAVGVPLANYIRMVALRQAIQRELPGYVTVARKELAERMAEEIGALRINIVDPGESVVRARAKQHVAKLWQLAAMRRRYASDRDIARNCDEAISAWYERAWGVPESMLEYVS